MKTLKEFVESHNINEGTGDNWDMNINSHKKAYNDLLKWYDKNLKSMNRDELIDCLRNAIKLWENDDFDNL